MLKDHHQSHLLAFREELDKGQRQDLLAQIQRLDLDKIDVWVKKFIKNPASDTISGDFVPALSYNPTPVGPEQQRKYAEAVKLGKELI